MINMSIPDFIQSLQCEAIENTPATHWYDISNWEIVKSINEFNNNSKCFFETVSKLVYYFTHPKVLAWIMWTGVVKYSFWICIFVCLFSIIAYLVGWQKGKAFAKGSVIAYAIIMMFNSALS